MQVMPGTARLVARRLGIATPAINSVDGNLQLGTAYLAGLQGEFNSLALSSAGYNAGPGNVKKWVKKNGHLPLDEFIEEIPYDETRGYVKRVMRSVFVYRSILGK